MSLIELGEVGHTPEAVTPPSRPPHPSRRRWITAGALLTLLLTGMGGGAPSPRPMPEATIPAQLGAVVFAEGDRLFVIDPPARSAESFIAAYRLPAAEPLWRVPVPVGRPGWTAQLLQHRLAGETLVVSAVSESLPNQADQVAGLDARTGRLLWHHPGRLMDVTAQDSVLLVLAERDATRTGPTVAALAPESGALRWSLALPPDGEFVHDFDSAQPRSLVAVRGSGQTQVRDLESGKVVQEARLPIEARPDGPPMQVIAGLLLEFDDGRRTLAAYGLDRLDRRWVIPLTSVDRPFTSSCGDSLCVWSHNTGVRVVDPRDGRTRWSDPLWIDVEQVGRHMVASPFRTTFGEAGMLVVLDPATGRRIGTFDAWSRVGPPRADGRLLAIRRDSGTGRTEVALLDPATLTVRPVAMLDRISGQCDGVPGIMFCRRLDSSVGVWRLPE
ncbi:PQQ-binding-like beta-propeller repeat protein [Micromonospora sp. NPDC049679]|uniref:outer membrane protein assembly factor BamB family protein n=1 Tax=Micromonospora sp. NPDC049679 TaxID=3155920 RepID=UPI0033C47E0D